MHYLIVHTEDTDFVASLLSRIFAEARARAADGTNLGPKKWLMNGSFNNIFVERYVTYILYIII